MFRRNHLRKTLLFFLMLILLTQCGCLRNSEIFQDAQRVEHEDVLAKITDYQVCIYQKDQADWVLTQEIETGTKILGAFLSGEFFIIEEEGYYLTLYKKGGKVNSLETEYHWMARVQLNTEQKIEAVEVKEKIVAVRFQQATDFYDISVKKWTSQRNERMMQATFQPFVPISTETSHIQRMKFVENYLVYTGYFSPMKLAKYDGSATFSSVFVSPGNSDTVVQFNGARKWLFQAQDYKINWYADEGSGYELKQVIQNTSISAPRDMDVHQEYCLISGNNKFLLLYKWDGSLFNLEHNFTQHSADRFYGSKMCNDGNIITILLRPVDGKLRVLLRMYNSSNNYQLAQELFTEETSIPYTLVATDDCETVVVHSISTRSSTRIYIVHRNEIGDFVMINNNLSPQESYNRGSCIHPDGDFFLIVRSGGDLWLRNYQSGDYAYHSTIDSTMDYYSCAINHDMVALSDMNKQVSFSLYTQQTGTEIEDPPGYGRKIEVQISQPQLIPETQRKPIDIAFTQDSLVVANQYSGSNVYKQESGSFIQYSTLDNGQFLSSLDYENSLQILVQGGYGQTAYVYKDSESGLSSVQNISTESQVLAVDLDANGRLLLGHMNGDISEYQWDSSTFNAKNKFPTEGSRIYGVKSCPQEEIVALREKEGRFYLQLLGEGGSYLKHSTQLGELLVVKFAVTSDCKRVFISSNMQMQVQVFVMGRGSFSLFRTIQESVPLYDIAIHPQADLFVVNRHVHHSSAIYRYSSSTEDYELEEVIQGDFDHVAVQVSDDQIVLADIHGKVLVYNYTYSLKTGFGQKELTPISDSTTVAAPRSITNMDISADLVVASTLYTGVLLFQIPASGEASVATFNENIFVSSVSIISALKTFAVGTHSKSVLIYIDSGSDYELNQTIITDSQVTNIDLCKENKLLVGMMNGDLAEFSSDGSSFTSSVNISNPNSQIYAAELCPDRAKVVILEAAGVFNLTIFPADDSGPVSFVNELEEEFIQPYLSVSQDCSIIAVSGVSMQKVQVFRKETDYQLFKSIQIGSPLSKVSVEEDGDILIVPSIISPESYVYQYLQCTEIYGLVQTLDSGTYDESTAINSQYILQGNFDGTIKISKYSAIYNANCESIDSSTRFRQKKSQKSEAQSSEDHEDYKKMFTTDSKNQDYSSEGDTMSSGMIFLIIIGAATLIPVIVTFIRWKWKKTPKNEESEEKSTVQSAKQIESQTF